MRYLLLLLAITVLPPQAVAQPCSKEYDEFKDRVTIKCDTHKIHAPDGGGIISTSRVLWIERTDQSLPQFLVYNNFWVGSESYYDLLEVKNAYILADNTRITQPVEVEDEAVTHFTLHQDHVEDIVEAGELRVRIGEYEMDLSVLVSDLRYLLKADKSKPGQR